jgi:hypothetical protein
VGHVSSEIWEPLLWESLLWESLLWESLLWESLRGCGHVSSEIRRARRGLEATWPLSRYERMWMPRCLGYQLYRLSSI